MQNLLIDETKCTLYIELLFDKRQISFKGKSYPENTFDFYMPVISWLKTIFQGQKRKQSLILKSHILTLLALNYSLIFSIF